MVRGEIENGMESGKWKSESSNSLFSDAVFYSLISILLSIFYQQFSFFVLLYYFACPNERMHSFGRVFRSVTSSLWFSFSFPLKAFR